MQIFPKPFNTLVGSILRMRCNKEADMKKLIYDRHSTKRKR